MPTFAKSQLRAPEPGAIARDASFPLFFEGLRHPVALFRSAVSWENTT